MRNDSSASGHRAGACLLAVVPLSVEPQVGGLKSRKRGQSSCWILPGSISSSQDLRSSSHPLLKRQLRQPAPRLSLKIGSKDYQHTVSLQMCRTSPKRCVSHIDLWPATVLNNHKSPAEYPDNLATAQRDMQQISSPLAIGQK